MNWQERMEAAIDYIESNLEGTEDKGAALEYSAAAQRANCSLFHFMRMFEIVTGVGVGEYARRRRLSLAAQALASGLTSVIDAGLTAGYESPDAFGRAFKREFGLTPSEAKEPGARLKAWPRLAFSVVLKGDIPMDMRFEKRDAFRLTGLSQRVSTADGNNWRQIPAFWESELKPGGRFTALEACILPGSPMGVMGVCDCDMGSDGSFSYLIAIESPARGSSQEKALPPGCVSIEAPAATWAVFESRGPLPGAIQAVWKRIFSEWFPSSGYEHAEGPELEVYAMGDSQASDYYSEVWIPVKKA